MFDSEAAIKPLNSYATNSKMIDEINNNVAKSGENNIPRVQTLLSNKQQCNTEKTKK